MVQIEEICIGLPTFPRTWAKFRPKSTLLAIVALLICVLLSLRQILHFNFIAFHGSLAEKESYEWRGPRNIIYSNSWYQGRKLKSKNYIDKDVFNKVSFLNPSIEEESTHVHSSTYEDEPHIATKVTRIYESSLSQETEKLRFKLRSLQKAILIAQIEGQKALEELESTSNYSHFVYDKSSILCPRSIFMVTEKEIKKENHFMSLPCGITIGSSITLIGVPHPPHYEKVPRIGHIANGEPVSTEVSQFMFELHAPKVNGSEEPSRILHINPRLKGDWNDKPVIELNTFLNGQWGTSQRCDGTPSLYHETVEGSLKCEQWIQKDDNEKESPLWLDRVIEKSELSWKYPFSQNHSFILTVRAGLEGYHMSVDGKHVASFPYTTGFIEELTTGSFVGGDVDVQALIATSLPSLPPKSIDEKIFENGYLLRTPKFKNGPIDLFIGVLSASDHFTQRMAMRSSWFQAEPIKSAKVVTRFFVAMHPDKDVNIHVKKEASYYGDMVLLPFMDEYNLVVLKTLAICEYAVHNVSTNYIMKCDDDTYVRVDAVLNELKMANHNQGLYMGNMNMFHRPLRMGKWAVTFEEWPDEVYPTYANGLGYIISTNIAQFIVTQNRRKALELFKMEDVSMGLWVHQFQQGGGSVRIANMWKFYQARCEDGYILAHYQSPRQMLCMHKKLLQGDLHCCN